MSEMSWSNKEIKKAFDTFGIIAESLQWMSLENLFMLRAKSEALSNIITAELSRRADKLTEGE